MLPHNLKRYPQAGFTLIEILVGLMITSLLFVGGYTAYREFQRRQIVSTTVSELRTNLTLARQKALSGEKTTSCVTSIDGFDFTLGTDFSQTTVSGATTYSYRPSCGLVSTLSYPSSTTFVTLSSGVTVAATGTNRSGGAVPTLPVKFKTIAQGTNMCTTCEMLLTVTQTSTGTTGSVKICASGAILAGSDTCQ